MAASWHAMAVPATRRRSRSFLFVKLWLIFAPVLAIVLWLSNVPASWFAYLIIASAAAIALSLRRADASARSSARQARRPLWTRSQTSRTSIARTKPRTPALRSPQRGPRGPMVARQPRPRPGPAPRAPATRQRGY